MERGQPIEVQPSAAIAGLVAGPGEALTSSPSAVGNLRPSSGNHSAEFLCAGSSARADHGGRYTVVADARIDNCHELSSALGVEDHLPLGELILRAYLRWGERVPEHLLGDFAFAVWDHDHQTLFCARDPIGVRPFYFSSQPDSFAFATDVASLVELAALPTRLDEAELATYLWGLRSAQLERTMHASVRRLPPGHSLTWRPGLTQLHRHWNPDSVPDLRHVDETDYCEAFVELLGRAVRQRIGAARQPGAHLSGGLDASSVHALAIGFAGTVPGYSWQPPPGDGVRDLDHDLIESLVARFGFKRTFQRLTAADVVEVLERDPVWQPTDDTLVHELSVQRQAHADGTDLLLSGWGGDECATFNGRGYYAQLLGAGRFRDLLHACRERSARPWRFLFRNAVLPQLPAPVHRIFDRQVGVREADRFLKKYVHPDIWPRLRRTASEVPRPLWRPASIRQAQSQLLEYGHLGRRIESWVAAGQETGLQYAFPLIDRRILEFALGVPPEMHVRGGETRHLMRQAMAGVLPDRVRVNRDKSDPSRARAVTSVCDEAYREVAERLEANTSQPLHGEYFNVPALIVRLQDDRPVAGVESAVIWRILQVIGLT